MTDFTAEIYQSQIPAMQMLVAMGYIPLSGSAALALRGGRKRSVVLDDVLVEKILEINRFTYRGKEYAFDLADAQEAVRRLKPTPDKIKGLRATNQEVYDRLLLGTTIAKTIDGDSKSYTLRYIDWDRPEANVFHVTAEMEVERTGGSKIRRCDIVGFVNGIPFVVIENKRPTVPLDKAEGQLLKYQGESNIPHLFHFSQLLLSMNRKEARYATVGTPKRFWAHWREEAPGDEDLAALTARGLTEGERAELARDMPPASEYEEPAEAEALDDLANKPMGLAEEGAVFSGPMTSALGFFNRLTAAGPRAVTEQDRLLHALCRPDRLLDLTRRFTVFEDGVRKIARHPQYFSILAALDHVKTQRADGGRQNGVIWHTQGSGKSLTMVMLGRALALDPDISNPRIIIVTDRDDLDRQIKGTFKSCDMEPVRATSGSHLGTLIAEKAPLITTLVHKFDRVLSRHELRDDDPNIFVLVDESHRTQTGKRGGFSQFGREMRRILPNACYLGFTGTPLLKKEKNTLSTFGPLIHKYAIDEAIRDGAVVPLLYEGRLVEQEVTRGALDKWFEKISANLSDAQKADLKRKYSRMDALSKTEQAIRAKAFDISEHYRQYWQGTGFKAQLVAPSKAAAVRFKEILDEIGHVTSEIVISPPADSEGAEEVDQEAKDRVQAFWASMMEKYGSEEDYNRRIIDAFKSGDDPEILIVVSKLLTGFDAPRNTVLYLCKSLKEHTLLQAIARVNRLFEDEERRQEKQFGFIIDYEGMLGELDRALSTYSAFDGYDPEDLTDAVADIKEEIRRLPQLHEQLWDIFNPVSNKSDMEQLEQFLRDDAIREEFYERLTAFARCLHISLSSDKLFDELSEHAVAGMRRDFKMLSELRRSVQVRYLEKIDMQDYEPKIRKLLDDHVTAMPAEILIEPVNINDPSSLAKVIEEKGLSVTAKADRIAAATRRAITESMEQDPAFLKRFSEMLEATLKDYLAQRLSEKDYLSKVADIAETVAGRKDSNRVPESLRGDPVGRAFYGIVRENIGVDTPAEQAAQVGIDLKELIASHHIVGIWTNDIVLGKLQNAIDDYLFDTAPGVLGTELSESAIDQLQKDAIKLARSHFPG